MCRHQDGMEPEAANDGHCDVMSFDDVDVADTHAHTHDHHSLRCLAPLTPIHAPIMSEVCKMTHIMRGSSYAITLVRPYSSLAHTISLRGSRADTNRSATVLDVRLRDCYHHARRPVCHVVQRLCTVQLDAFDRLLRHVAHDDHVPAAAVAHHGAVLRGVGLLPVQASARQTMGDVGACLTRTRLESVACALLDSLT